MEDSARWGPLHRVRRDEHSGRSQTPHPKTDSGIPQTGLRSHHHSPKSHTRGAMPSVSFRGAVARTFTLLALFATLALHAQGVGEIRGFAWDSDGKPISGAKIELSGDASQTVTAATDGSFAFPNLPVGHYRIAGSEEKRQI